MSASSTLSLVVVAMSRRRRRKKPAREYMSKILAERESRGEFFLVKEMEEDEAYFHNYFRMNKQAFHNILRRILPKIEHPPNHRHPISPPFRLAFTLRYLCTGINEKNLAISYRISPASATNILNETLDAIWDSLHGEYMKTPTSSEEWKKIADEFWMKWQFPNCVGAMDGKHCRQRAPHNSRTEFHNFEGFFSKVLLALVDANYKFIYVDIGAQGSLSDAGILSNSDFGRALDNGQLNFPPDSHLPSSPIVTPHVILGDSGFQLKNNFLRPYGITTTSVAEKVFNHRLSRARRVSQNCFGIFGARFRIFFTCIEATGLMEKIMKACVVLHNFIKSEDRQDYLREDIGDNDNGTWREIAREEGGFENLELQNTNNIDNDRFHTNCIVEQ